MTRWSQVAAAALAASTLIGSAAAAAQPAARASARSLDLDASPSALSTPDPLAPPDEAGPAPMAPGAPVVSEPKPATEADPIVALVRQRLAVPLTHGAVGEREDYAGLAAFYADGTGQPLWTSTAGFTPKAEQVMAEIRKADDWGMRAADFDLPSPPDASTSSLAEAEIKLGLAVLKYGRHARGGRLDPSAISRMFDQRPAVYDPKSLMQALAANAAPDAYLRELHPQHAQFQRLRAALLAARGAKAESEAGAAAVTIPRGPKIAPGQEHPHVVLVRQRLAVAGEPGKEAVYDGALVEEIKAFQRHNELPPSGLIDSALRNALNGGAAPSAGKESIQRLIANMERWRWLPRDLGDFYVWDSVPEQITAVYEHGKQVLAEKIVVGKPSTPTPIFSAAMQFIIFHPSWGVPPGMKTQELLPQLRNTGGWFFGTSASSVLSAHGLQVSRGGHPIDPDSVNWQSVDIRAFDFTQPPGPRNVLGMVKFRFPNKHDVYMHDTPERNLFGGAVRAFSHGCMRVQNPVSLAEVVLAHDKGWSPDKVQEYVRHGGEIKLDKPIPVHVTYFTVSVDDEGKVHTHGDIYGLDGRVASALEGRTVHLASAAVSSEARLADAAADPQPGRRRSQRVRQKATPAFNPFSW